LVEQVAAACCYAESDKYIPIYGADTDAAPKADACCVPLNATTDERCCAPAPSSTTACGA
jgi:hypothetical protein